MEKISLSFNKTWKFEPQILYNYFSVISLVAIMKIGLDFKNLTLFCV